MSKEQVARVRVFVKMAWFARTVKGIKEKRVHTIEIEISETAIQADVEELILECTTDYKPTIAKLYSAIENDVYIDRMLECLVKKLRVQQELQAATAVLAAICIKNSSHSSLIAQKLVKLQVGPYMLQVIASWPPETQVDATTIVSILSMYAEFTTQILQLDLVDLFVSLARTHQTLLGILARCTQASKSLAARIASSNSLQAFMNCNLGFPLYEALVGHGFMFERVFDNDLSCYDHEAVLLLEKVLQHYEKNMSVSVAERAFTICVRGAAVFSGARVAEMLSKYMELNTNFHALLVNKGAVDQVVRQTKIKGEAAAILFRALLKNKPSKMYAVIKAANIALDTLDKSLKDAILGYLNSLPTTTVANVRDTSAPWYIDPKLLSEHAHMKKKYHIIPGQPNDRKFVTELYQQSPVHGYDLKDVHIVSSDHLLLMFAGRIALLQQRHNNKAFKPNWEQNNVDSEELAQRKQTMDLFATLSKQYFYERTPYVSFVPLWHGTKPEVLDSVFTTGFANLAKTDVGFFGKGLYSTGEAEYAHRVYSAGALLINWVASYSIFPVIAQDEELLSEKGNFENYDAHFVPVCSPYHPKTTNYHACSYGEKHQYTEMVVFESSQMLPYYIVELQPSLPLDVNVAIPITMLLKNSSSSSTPQTPSTTTHQPKPLRDWSLEEVCAWVSSLALSKSYTEELLENFITGEVLKSMKRQDWQEIGVKDIGDIRVLILSTAKLLN